MAAAAAYRRVRSALGEVADMWLVRAEWDRFVACHWDLAEEARRCLVSLGAAEEAERLAAPHLRWENPAERSAAALLLRDRRIRRIGLSFMLLNLLAVVVVVSFILRLGAKVPFPLFLVGFSLVLLTLFQALYLAVYATLGRVVPLLRRSGGAVILLLACFPWAMVVTSLALYLLDVN